MKTNKRHIFIEQNEWNKISISIEEIDNFINHSKSFEFLSNHIVVYGQAGNSNIKVGREVVGYDQELKHHSNILSLDYSFSSVSRIQASARSYESLMSEIESSCLRLKAEFYRVETMDYESFVIDFFNLEK